MCTFIYYFSLLYCSSCFQYTNQLLTLVSLYVVHQFPLIQMNSSTSPLSQHNPLFFVLVPGVHHSLFAMTIVHTYYHPSISLLPIARQPVSRSSHLSNPIRPDLQDPQDHQPERDTDSLVSAARRRTRTVTRPVL